VLLYRGAIGKVGTAVGWLQKHEAVHGRVPGSGSVFIPCEQDALLRGRNNARQQVIAGIPVTIGLRLEDKRGMRFAHARLIEEVVVINEKTGVRLC